MPIRKQIQYLSSRPGSNVGILFVSYKQDGITKRKSFSRHPSGRTEDEALKLAHDFIKENNIDIEVRS